jgi:MFS transporter, PAT family, beta-lactamase induction signal transducer AmpG
VKGAPARVPGFARRMRWVTILYFAEGFPYGVFLEVWPVFFRSHGMSLQEIGLADLLGLPWVLKFLWAPLVDRFGDRRRWISGCLFAMGGLLMLHAAFDPAHPSVVFWGVLLLFTIASATQDIAVDAHTIAILPAEEVGAANGIRVSAYRVAMILSGGGLVLGANFAGWNPLWIAGGGLLALWGLLVFRAPAAPVRLEERRRFLQPLLLWLSRPGSAAALAFILLYKLGDQVITKMIKPFWVDRGLTLAEIGLVSTTLGIVFTILGALLGGFLTTRWGLIRALFILGIAQVLPNLGYAACAALHAGHVAIYLASVAESFGQGLGTAAFLTLLMRLCDKEHAATQYALLSALFSLTRHLSGAASGFAAHQLGYAEFFTYTFFLAIPGLALVPFLRRRLEAAGHGAPGDTMSGS